jgi:putative ABC transport system permease protein
LIGTLFIAKQMGYIQNMNLGFERDNVVMLSFNDEETSDLAKVLKSRLEAYPKVRGVTVSDSSPLALSIFLGGSSVQKEDGEIIKIDFHLAHVDDDFLRVYGLKIAEGRNFSPQFPSDADGILVNQALVRKIGWKNPIGRKLMKSSVIGVVEDFHFATLHKEIAPAAFSRKGAFMGKTLLGIKIRPEDPEGTLTEIKAICAQASAGRTLDFYFLDDAFNGLYRRERRLASIIGSLEGVAILLGCMGLFGLTTYAAQRRAKEIGIRKVLGATVFRIIRMMSGEFLVLMFIANVIAWPIGQYFMRKWLQEYAYRCSIGIGVFILAGLGTMLLAFVVVGLQTLKASLANPVESLRYD